MKSAFRYLLLVAPLVLAACTTIPSGPGVMVLPGTGKNFDDFRLNDIECRQFSNAQIGGKSPNQAGTDSGMKSAVVGTVIGAAAGAAIGGGQGAAIGAGVGLAGGAVAGTASADQSSYGLQRRYDIAYTQCMYAKGHKVPVSGRFESANSPAPAARTPPPPPPPGAPPPPPPR
ncbi:MAG: glycine zipper family protein [Burkholderiales bacterium]